MENNNLGNGIVYDYAIIADKHYFGGFLNLAKDNIDAVFKAYEDRFGENVPDMKIENLSYQDYQNRIDFLKYYFPVINYLDLPVSDKEFENIRDKEPKRRKYFRENFKTLYKAVSALRHFYTHYYHEPLSFEMNLFSLLDKIFISVIEDIKKEKKNDNKTRPLLNRNLKEELKCLMALKKQELKEKQKSQKNISLDEVSIQNAVFNDAFSQFFNKEKKISRFYQAENTDTDIENKLNISQTGLLFLLGMFLTKKQSEDLRSRIRRFKNKIIKNQDHPVSKQNNSLKYMSTQWVFGYLAFKGLKSTLNTTFMQETLLTQIVDELSKVPNEIYRNLSQEQQQLFIEDMNEYVQDGNNVKSLEDAIVIHPVIRKRYEDKFPYFVIRYLDEYAGFPTLKFQIQLGNYVHDKRTKKIQGTVYSTERVVKEKITVFGKLSEITALKDNYLKKRTQNNEENRGWEIYPNPSYNFTGNNIPIYLDLESSNVPGAKQLYGNIQKQCADLRKKNIENQDQTERADKATKHDIVKLIDSKKIVIKKPTAFLSLNELSGLLYELLVNKKNGKQIEDILIKKLIEHYDTISEFSTENPLPTSQITKKLLKSNSESQWNTGKLMRDIEREIAVTEHKLNLIKDKRDSLSRYNLKEKIRKPVFSNRAAGKEAVWIAEDLVRFMPKAVRKNWKGYHHSQLQQSLAFYEQRPNEAVNLVKQYWNLNDTRYCWNEGIKKSFERSEFDLFYEAYLKNRKKILNLYRDKLSDNMENMESMMQDEHLDFIFNRHLYKIDTTENQKLKLLAHPFVFPRGIFDEKPTYIKGKSMTETPELYAEWYRYANQRIESQQFFYKTPRDYKDLYNTMKEHKKEIDENKYNLSEIEKYNLFKNKQDKAIKKVQMQDVFLELIVKDLFNRIFPNQGCDFSLKDFTDIHNDTWNISVPFQWKQIREPEVKLKDIGKFKRFLFDKKIENILSYNEDKIWTKRELEEELELLPSSYEVIRREQLLKLIQELENCILQKNNFDGVNHPKEFEQSDEDKKAYPNFKHYITEGILKKCTLAENTDIEWLNQLKEDTFEKVPLQELCMKPKIIQKAYLLVLIRNKISHNQLPKKEYFERIKTMFSPAEANETISYSSIILNFTKSVIQELKTYLK